MQATAPAPAPATGSGQQYRREAEEKAAQKKELFYELFGSESDDGMQVDEQVCACLV